MPDPCSEQDRQIFREYRINPKFKAYKIKLKRYLKINKNNRILQIQIPESWEHGSRYPNMPGKAARSLGNHRLRQTEGGAMKTTPIRPTTG